MSETPGHASLSRETSSQGLHELDRFADTVRARLGVPLALVSLVHDGDDRQVLAGLSGHLPEPYASERQTPLTHSFCRYVVHDRGPLVIDDAREDPRLRGNPAIEDLGVVAYAGFPLHDDTGTVVGSLCAIDHSPRRWTEGDLAELSHLAGRCSDELQHLQRAGARSVVRQAAHGWSPEDDAHVAERSRVLLALSETLAETIDVADVASAVTDVSVHQLGCLRAGLWLRQTDLPRDQADLPEGVTPDRRVLCWVRDRNAAWLQASAFDRVPLDDSTPVGRAATTSEPAFYVSRAEQNAEFPDLAHARQEGERRAFLPLINRGRLFGTLTLVWPDEGPVTAQQRTTVRALASYAAQALERASLRQEGADALVALQRSLMPTIPATDEAELAARYLPASSHDRIGGDWYDALVPGPGRLEVMIGDVVGHDIAAAATMGQIRTMLRVIAATVDDGPAAQVGRLDRALEDLAVAGMATLVQAHLIRDEPVDVPDGSSGAGTWQLVWTNAGHPPPAVLLPGGEVRLLEADDTDVLVGVSGSTERHEHRVRLPVGTTLLLYTDGLVERRGETLDVGFARLLDSLVRHGSLGLDGLLDAVLADLLGASRIDDVAMLGVRL